ncbi:iron-sulfur cluster biosynthesis family protein [Virgibacillus soli]|uniref:Iron-sulfur cluster biosynthesis family protein n=1 Tax=Paracerasibacillus soli TaxID=480284 RepID=A0ABU5CRE2_9BACI|nr:iron-sulfur cluster biosynthesis family protein [Virgibacillus soli]MDY0408372.1 iron-sulfur cluster biosynthesis family protein [Virgibacillus soli]
MQLKITDEAVEQLQTLNHENKQFLLLWYDIEGCGCGVNGVPTIRFVNEVKDYHVSVKNEVFKTYISEQQMTFFAPTMILQFMQGAFRLSSPNEILNPFISISSINQPLEEGTEAR